MPNEVAGINIILGGEFMEIEEIKEFDKKLGIRDGFASGLPIVIGYFPIAMAFGILSKTTGVSMFQSFLFSLMVFAGASQFMALNLLSLGAGIGQIILTTLLVNFRHFLMGASISAKMTEDMKKWSLLMAFGITDEVFSVASFKKEQITTKFMLALQFVSYSSWVIGTVFGYLVGQVLPEILKDSMGIALYAMFAAILIPEAKKSKRVGILALLSGLVNVILSYLKILPQGWSLIIAIVLISAIGTFIFDDGEVNEHE